MSKPAIEAWKQAHDLFEIYIDKPLSQAIKEINLRNDISKETKCILLKLLNAQPQDVTTIDKVDLSFFSSLEESIQDLTGKSIDDYYLLEQIGTGGMSTVYKAKRLNRDIQKHVALKVLTSSNEKPNEKLEQLFEQEQITLAKLNHKNIISFHHGGISNDGVTYLVMDYLESAKSINHYCQFKNLSTKEIIKLILPIADAVYYAHQQLVIHKDIKPNNLLIDKHGVPYLLDFGISSLTDKIKKVNEPNIYTPDYASPEQIQNKTVTISSDIFSFTATLLSLLVNKKPLPHFNHKDYDNKNDQIYVSELLTKSHLNVDLKNIILKGLASNPQHRYQSMLEIKSDLSNWLLLKPISATSNTSFYLINKFIRRNPFSSMLVSSLILVVISSLYIMFQQMESAKIETQKAKLVTDFLLESIQASDPDITKGKEVSVKEFLAIATLKIQESTLIEPALESTLKESIGTALVKVGEYKKAEKLLLDALVSMDNNYDARLALLQLFNEQKQYDKLEKGILYLNNHVDKLSPSQHITLQQIEALKLFKQGQFEQAIIKIQQTIDIGGDIKQSITSQLILADILDEKGEPQKATQLLENTIKTSQKHFPELSTITLSIYKKLVKIITNYDDVPYERLNNLYSKIITNEEIIYGSKHPQLAKTYLQYGFLLKIMGKTKEAYVYGDKARLIAVENFGNNHILTAHVDLLLSQLLLIENNKEAATKKLEDVVRIYQNTYGNNHFETNQVKTTLAFYYLSSQQAGKALELLMPLYELQKQQLGENNKATLYVVVNILKAYSLLGLHDKAIELGDKTLPLSQQHLGKAFAITIGIQANLSQSYLALGQFSKAYKLLYPLIEMNYVKNNPAYLAKISSLLKKAENNRAKKNL